MPRPTNTFQVAIICGILLGACTTKGLREQKVGAEKEAPASAQLQALRTSAYQQVINQNFEAAIAQYESARALAGKEGNQKLATQFLLNIAGCYQTISAYRDAIKTFQTALEESKRFGFEKFQETALMNMASLMQDMGESQSAADLLKQTHLDGSAIPVDGQVAAFMQQVNIFSQMREEQQAQAALQRALKAAAAPPSSAMKTAYKKQFEKWPESISDLRRAWVYGFYTQVLIKQKRFEEAEEYALEAFRLRSIYGDKSRLRDCIQLAALSRQRNDPNGAERYLNLARGFGEANGHPMQMFLINREQGMIELARGDYNAALPPIQNAIERARKWRMDVLPSDAAFLNFEARMSREMQAVFLSTILRSDVDLSRKDLAEETFWVAEEARFASMRASQFPASEFAKRLPKEYWASLDRYQRMQARIAAGGDENPGQLQDLESKLKLIEMQAGLEIPQAPSGRATDTGAWLKSLPEDEVIFSFYLGEPNSLAWVASKRGIQVRKIAGRQRIAGLVQGFRESILAGNQNGTLSTGSELLQQLFGENLKLHRTTPFWTMVVDQELANLPFGALPVEGPGGKYLVQHHNLRFVPSAMTVKRVAKVEWARRAEAIGDPVYNVADGRAVNSPFQNARWLELNRLPSSRGEVKESLKQMEGRGWKVAEHLDFDANRDTFVKLISNSPDVFHVSAHFVRLNSGEQVGIALSPTGSTNASSLITNLDLNSIRTATKLVVLSGCRSAGGEAIESIGINGLARAFLISGVSSVVATLWPVLDSNGPLFRVFYGELVEEEWSGRSAAMALQSAQLEMIRRGGASANPAYWAAYVAISKG